MMKNDPKRHRLRLCNDSHSRSMDVVLSMKVAVILLVKLKLPGAGAFQSIEQETYKYNDCHKFWHLYRLERSKMPGHVPEEEIIPIRISQASKVITKRTQHASQTRGQPGVALECSYIFYEGLFPDVLRSQKRDNNIKEDRDAL